MIAKCQLCDKRANWHDLGKIQKNKVNLVCDKHLPPKSEHDGHKWTYSDTGWCPPEYSSRKIPIDTKN